MKRILSIDGGGIKGVFPISFLAAVENVIECNISDYFDLIAGTSTGGIIAVGLGMGFSAKDILAFYEKLGPNIFKGNRFLRLIRQLGFSKYSSEPLKKALEEKFGSRLLGESKTRLIITSQNLETGEVYVFKTAHHPRFEVDYRKKAVDVALATAAAPTYFPTHKSAVGEPLVDGGTYAVNPTGMAVVEAISVLGWKAEELKVLSLGCTFEPLNIHKRKLSLGIAAYANRIIDVFMLGQSSLSMGTASLICEKENILRISPVVGKGRFGLDSYKEIESLKGLGSSEARKAIPKLRDLLDFSVKTDYFEPFHKIL